MIIKSLEIISFGKFKNKTIDFADGLNVICGDNESGKSTIMSFIYAMLYGFGDNRGKSVSLREKYTPWDGGVCEGKMTLSAENGEDITIYRKAGSVKKQDTLRVYNPLTGEDISRLPEDIIGVGSETFSKTLCINQLSTIFSGTSDEIVQKLANIAGGGDENVSFEKAVKILENARREIKPLRGSGGTLSQLNTQIADLEKKRAEYQAMQSELEGARKLLPHLQKAATDANEKYEKESMIDFVSPVAHLRGRIEEKEAFVNTAPRKAAFSPKKGYMLSAAALAVIAAIILFLSPIFALLPLICAIACAIIGIRIKNTAPDFNIYDDIQKLKEELTLLENKKAVHDRNLLVLKENSRTAEEKLSALNVRINSLKMQLAQDDGENLDLFYKKRKELEKQLRALTLATEALNTAHEKMQRDFTPLLNKKASEYFCAITSGKYTRIFSDEQFNLSIDLDIPRKSELFSGGTVDQLYLSLRLALIDMLFGDATTFVLLDQPFLQYDIKRREKSVGLLECLSKRRQFLLFTSDATVFSPNKQTEILT